MRNSARHFPVPAVESINMGARADLPEDEICEMHPEFQPLNRKAHEDGSGFPRYPGHGTRSMSIRSQPEDPCYTCLRTTVHCYNILILIIGLGVLGIGIWLLVAEFSAREVSVLIGTSYFEFATYLMVGAGGAIALLAFCGCCGTMREDKCVLAFYGATLLVTIFALIASATLAFLSLGMTVAVKNDMQKTLSSQYGVDLRKNSDNRLITDAWDSLQRSFECCGPHGDANSTSSWAFYKLHSQWYTQTNMRAPYVPESCCRDGNKAVCTGVETINGAPTRGPPMDKLYVHNDFLYTEGCYDKVLDNMRRNVYILGGVASIVPLLLIIGIIVVFCMCCKVRKDEFEEEQDI